MVVAIDPLRVAYMAVPKAACSSVKAALAAVDPRVDRGRDVLSADPLEVHQIYPTMRFRKHRWVTFEGWFRFTVVRDPLKRLLSVYTDRVVDRAELYNARSFRTGQAPLPQDPDPDYFFLHLDAFAQWSSVIKHHILPQSIFTGPYLGRYSKVYRTADIPTLAADLSETTGRAVKIPRMNASKANLDYMSLDRATRRVIRDRLEPEYAHLEGFFERPWPV